MQQRDLLLLFVLLTSSVLAQNPTATDIQPNTTNSMLGFDCSLNNSDCNGHGVCQNDGTCRCFVGFYPQANYLVGADCSRGSPGPVSNSIRIFCGAGFGFLLILIGYRFVLELIFSTVEVGAAKWTTRWNMGLIVVFCIWMTVQCIDYAGVYGIMSSKAWLALYYFRDNLQLFIFASLLFHWADLYYKSIRKIRHVHMIQKLKPEYEGNVTMDSVLLELNLMSRFRLGYVAVCVATFFVYIGQNVINAYSKDISQYKSYHIFYQVFYLCTWVLFAGGYLYYGLKLKKILPANNSSKVITVMVLMALFAIFACTASALNLQILINYQNTSLVNSRIQIMASYVLSWFIGFWAINIFMPIWQWHRWMNPVLIKSMWTDSTRGSGNTSQPSKEADLESKVEKAISILPVEEDVGSGI